MSQQISFQRRAWARVPNDQLVSCQPMTASTKDESDTAWLGRVRDVSRGGIALILDHRFEPGTALIVELLAIAQVVSRSGPVRVVRATPEKEGRWVIGCAFAKILTPEELTAFLRSPPFVPEPTQETKQVEGPEKYNETAD